MCNATVGTSGQSEDRNDSFRALISDLLSLIDHVQASIKQLELTFAEEKASDNSDASSNVIELDDVTPRYAVVRAALSACKASLSTAMEPQLDARQRHGRRSDDRMRLPRARSTAGI